MSHNKDKGTSVGFSEKAFSFGSSEKSIAASTNFHQVICNEKCGIKPPLDIIEDEFVKWNKIWEEWESVLAKWKANRLMDIQFFGWLKENYLVPIKK